MTASLVWKPEGDGFALYSHRRRFGRIVRDAKYPNIWRSIMPDGSLSDMAHLAWAKNAVLIAAERELAYETRPLKVAASTPTLLGKTGVFSSTEPHRCDISAKRMSGTGTTANSSLA